MLFRSEIAATAAQEIGCRVSRLGAPRIPVGYAAALENLARIGVEQVVQAAREIIAS